MHISLQHTATDCNRLQQTATDWNTLQHTATHCDTLQHTHAHIHVIIIYIPMKWFYTYIHTEQMILHLFTYRRKDSILIHIPRRGHRFECEKNISFVAVCCGVLRCAAVCCSVLQCVAVCCSVLQCVAVCCNVLQCVAACCSVLQFDTEERA